MIQKNTYTKEELKLGGTTELIVDFESFVDDLASWFVKYMFDHYVDKLTV